MVRIRPVHLQGLEVEGEEDRENKEDCGGGEVE